MGTDKTKKGKEDDVRIDKRSSNKGVEPSIRRRYHTRHLSYPQRARFNNTTSYRVTRYCGKRNDDQTDLLQMQKIRSRLNAQIELQPLHTLVMPEIYDKEQGISLLGGL